jgi:CDP-glucose 4,6-dehydratase
VLDKGFYQGKRVLITGHTGFKGSWLSLLLSHLGAQVTGIGLVPETSPALFDLANIESYVDSRFCDIRDYEKLRSIIAEKRPEVVLHLAAQPLVRRSYADPRYTFETNIMGTVNILECVRTTSSVESFLNVTTDKVYLNRELPDYAYREDDPLDGLDPYSNSKSCSELVTHSYRNSFFAHGQRAVSTARAGNVIGGGDFSEDRIIPDCVRAVSAGRRVKVRNPRSERPYQHVLEPLVAYLMIAQAQWEGAAKAGWYNIGPDREDCITTEHLVTLFCDAWGEGASWEQEAESGPHEALLLRLDNRKFSEAFNWRPRWHIGEAVAKTVIWTKIWLSGEDVTGCMLNQIEEYLKMTT